MKSLKNLRLTDKKGKLNLDSYLNVQKITVKAKYKENTLMNNLFYSLYPLFIKAQWQSQTYFYKDGKKSSFFFFYKTKANLLTLLPNKGIKNKKSKTDVKKTSRAAPPSVNYLKKHRTFPAPHCGRIERSSQAGKLIFSLNGRQTQITSPHIF